MSNFTLKQLRYVDALARHGHFGHAASACAISQPALSMQIKDLEESLGAILFERTPRQVRPTFLGEEFVQRARAILQLADELGDLSRASQDILVGHLRLGIIPTIAPYLLPTLIGTLSRRHENLDLQIRETLTSKLIQELNDGRLDTAIVALPVSEPALEEVALFAEDFVLVRHETEADQPVPDGETLRRMRLLLLEEGHCFRDQALSFCNMSSNLPRDGLDGSSLSTLVQMVGAGIGVTLIPDMAVPVETRSAPVSVARFEDPRPSRMIGMIWRKTSPMARQLAQIADAVREAADQMHRRHASQAGQAEILRKDLEIATPSASLSA